MEQRKTINVILPSPLLNKNLLFPMDEWTLQQVTASNVEMITWSNHAPMSIELGSLTKLRPFHLWRLDAALLAYPLLP